MHRTSVDRQTTKNWSEVRDGRNSERPFQKTVVIHFDYILCTAVRPKQYGKCSKVFAEMTPPRIGLFDELMP